MMSEGLIDTRLWHTRLIPDFGTLFTRLDTHVSTSPPEQLLMMLQGWHCKESSAADLEVQDDGGMQGADSQVQAAASHSDGQAHTAQSRTPLQLPGRFQLVILAGVCVKHSLYLQAVANPNCHTDRGTRQTDLYSFLSNAYVVIDCP